MLLQEQCITYSVWVRLNNKFRGLFGCQPQCSAETAVIQAKKKTGLELGVSVCVPVCLSVCIPLVKGPTTDDMWPEGKMLGWEPDSLSILPQPGPHGILV